MIPGHESASGERAWYGADDVSSWGAREASACAQGAVIRGARRRVSSPVKTIFLSFAVTATLVLSACSPAVRPAPVPAVTSTATPNPVPGPLKLGQARTLTFPKWGAARVTVYAYRQPLRSDYPPPQRGAVYAGADVKYCNVRSAKELSVSWEPWSLEFGDDTLIGAVDTWSPSWVSVPLYPPVGKVLPVGQCVRGWVLFAVPKTRRPARVTYAPAGDDGDQVPPTDWSIR